MIWREIKADISKPMFRPWICSNGLSELEPDSVLTDDNASSGSEKVSRTARDGGAAAKSRGPTQPCHWS